MPHVFLVGPRASGKSTLGGVLAQRLNLPFTDMDKVIEESLGTSIADYVQARGWEAFRTAESNVLVKLCSEPRRVVATGGGVVLKEQNRMRMRDSGTVLYLRADANILFERLQKDPMIEQRPALSALPLSGEIETTLKERGPLYNECADAVLDASAPLEALLLQALDALKKLHGAIE